MVHLTHFILCLQKKCTLNEGIKMVSMETLGLRGLHIDTRTQSLDCPLLCRHEAERHLNTYHDQQKTDTGRGPHFKMY